MAEFGARQVGGTARRVWLCVFGLAAVNMLVFTLIAFHLGGDAINGYSENGHYFLRNHEVVKEVSRRTFNYSRWHSRSLAVTHPLGLLAGFMLMKDRWQERSKRAF